MKRNRFDDWRKFNPFPSHPTLPNEGQSPIFGPGPVRPLFARRTLKPKEFADRNFSLGYELDQKERFEEASWVYRATVETLERWHQSQPQAAPASLLSLIALRHGARLIRLRRSRVGRMREIQTVFQTAITYAETARQLGSSSEVAEIQASALAWRGLACRATRDYSSALSSYQRATSLWRMLLVFARNRNERISHQRSLAAALFGTAKTLRLLGKNDEAALCRAESHYLFQRSRGTSC